jgi:hypothetical protein
MDNNSINSESIFKSSSRMILRCFVIIILIFSIPLAMLDYAHFPFSDGAEHGAAVRVLAQNFITPDDPCLRAIMAVLHVMCPVSLSWLPL